MKSQSEFLRRVWKTRGRPRLSRRDLWGGFGMIWAQNVDPKWGNHPKRLCPKQRSLFWLLEFLNVHFLIFPTSCSAHSPRIHDSAFFEISDVLFSAQESQKILKVHLLRFPTSCSAHRSPRISESAVFEISDVLLCASESQKF